MRSGRASRDIFRGATGCPVGAAPTPGCLWTRCCGLRGRPRPGAICQCVAVVGIAGHGTGPEDEAAVVHSANVGQFVVVHYHWHALFGRRLRVERVDRRRSGQFVHVEVLPGVFTVVAAWMLDPLVCTGTELGVPRVSLAALSDFDVRSRQKMYRPYCFFGAIRTTTMRRVRVP